MTELSTQGWSFWQKSYMQKSKFITRISIYFSKDKVSVTLSMKEAVLYSDHSDLPLGQIGWSPQGIVP